MTKIKKITATYGDYVREFEIGDNCVNGVVGSITYYDSTTLRIVDGDHNQMFDIVNCPCIVEYERS